MIDAKTFPAAFAAMDAAAAQFWAYPDAEWQDEFLVGWARQHDPALLAALIGVVKVADRATVEFDAARAAIAKAEGGAA